MVVFFSIKRACQRFMFKETAKFDHDIGDWDVSNASDFVSIIQYTNMSPERYRNSHY